MLQTIRVPCTTRITSLATDTTLAAATRHDFAAVTVYMPETTRTIKAVVVELTVADEFTAATDFDGIRVGIKINAVAFSDADTTITAGNSGDHTNMSWRRDVTSYFVTNDPGTASFTAQVGVAFATSAASNVTGITAVLEITYEHDESTTTRVKSICYPIQAHHTTLTSSYVEVGTTGGASNAPANQIRVIATGSAGNILPEASITIRHYWVDIHATSAGVGTDLTLTVRVDGSTDNARYNVEQSLSTPTHYFDRMDLTGLDTTSVHAFEAKSSAAASTFECLGGVVWVTYEYSTTSTTTLFNSLRVPLESSGSSPVVVPDTTAGDAERYQVLLDIQEPGTITMQQSGVVLYTGSNNSTRGVLASGQAVRAYAYTNQGTLRTSIHPVVHRCDHSSSTWALARGVNRLTLDVYSVSGVENTNNNHRGGYAIINYHSDVSASGIGAHSRTVMWPLSGTILTAAARGHISPTAPAIPETSFYIQGVFTDVNMFTSSVPGLTMGAERGAGEAQEGGWDYRNMPHTSVTDAENGTKHHAIPITDMWRRTYGVGETDPERMNIETTRDWAFFTPLLQASLMPDALHYITYHANLFTVAGVVEVDGSPVADGKTVEVWAKDANGIAERIGAPTTTGGTGSFTLEVLDNTRTYLCTYVDGTNRGRSANGAPETDTFDIEIFTSGGGGGYSRSRVVNPS